MPRPAVAPLDLELRKVIREAIQPTRTHGEAIDAIAAAVAPLIVARAWEAYLEGVRHGSDELDPEEFSDASPIERRYVTRWEDVDV